MKVVLIDDGAKPGGVCLNRGCIPSKALLHVAKLLHEAEEAAEYGVVFQKPVIQLDKLRTFKNTVIGNLSGGIEGLCKARGVELIKARGQFLNSGTLQLSFPDGTRKTLDYEHCIVATGSQPAMPPIFAIGDDRVMDSTAHSNSGTFRGGCW
jgi:dihydrolipoamide dehydrogenase